MSNRLLPGMTKTECLAAFADREVDSVNTVRTFLGISDGQARRHIADLVERGYLRRSSMLRTKGRPRPLYCITKAGHAVLKRLTPAAPPADQSLRERVSRLERRIAVLELHLGIVPGKLPPTQRAAS